MRHIDSQLLLNVLEGKLPPRTLLRVLAEHLRELCPECGATLQLLVDAEPSTLAELAVPELAAETAAFDALPRPDGDDPGVAHHAACSPYTAAFQQAGRRAVEYAAGLAGERRRAQRDLAALLALPASERRRRIANAHTRFRSRSFAELLVEHSRFAVRHDPEEARDLAELVAAVLYWMPGHAGRTWADQVYARSLAHRANALRVAGDLRAADEAFREVHALIARQAIDGEELHAEVVSLEASLRSDQRRFADAERLLDRAILFCRAAGDETGLAKNLIKRAEMQRLNDRLDESAASLSQALGLLDRDRDGFLYLCAIGSLSLHLCDAGRFAEAEEMVAAHAGLLDVAGDRWLELRMMLLRGRVAHGLGRVEEAERLFLVARDGHLEQRQGFDVALVSLDLASLYLEQGRTAELKRAARLMQPLFEARDVHREALAALILFEQAALAERVTEDTIQGLRRYLERTRSDRRLLAVEPS